MKNFFSIITAGVFAAVTDAKLIVMPPTTTTGTDVAIVWIHGMVCKKSKWG